MSLPKKRKKLENSLEDKTLPAQETEEFVKNPVLKKPTANSESQQRQPIRGKGRTRKKSTTPKSKTIVPKAKTVTTDAEVNQAFELVEDLDQRVLVSDEISIQADQQLSLSFEENVLFEGEAKRSLEASNIIQNHAMLAMVAGMVPAPFLDMLLATGVQVRMINQLAQLYGIEFSAARAKYLIIALGGNYAVEVSSLWGSYSMAKIFPGIGLVLGTAVLPVVMGVFTYAVGKVISHHFELGGMLFNFEQEANREYFKEQIKEGQRVLASLKRNKEKKNVQSILSQ